MKAATAILSSALLAAVSGAYVAPRDTTTSPEVVEEPAELREMFESAKAQVMDEVTENERKLRKRGQAPACAANKLVFRRE